MMSPSLIERAAAHLSLAQSGKLASISSTKKGRSAPTTLQSCVAIALSVAIAVVIGVVDLQRRLARLETEIGGLRAATAIHAPIDLVSYLSLSPPDLALSLAASTTLLLAEPPFLVRLDQPTVLRPR